MRKYSVVIERKTSELWIVEARTSHEAVMAVMDKQHAGDKPDRVTETGVKMMPVRPLLEEDDPKLPLK